MGRRRDGVRVKNLDAIHHLMPHIKPNRCDSDVYINVKVDMTETVKYLENLRKKEEYKDITYFHLMCTAIAKMVYNRPLLNRFIINKKFYDRNDVVISFVAKRELTDESEESFTVINVKEKDNLFTIRDEIVNKVKKLRENDQLGIDDFMNFIGRGPKWLKTFFVGCLKFADRHDWLPDSLTKDLLYYSTVIVSNLGSIGCNAAIYHNLTDFGTNSIMVMIGQVADTVTVEDGKPVVKKMCEFGINLDERIADGFYFVKSLQLFEYLLQNPHLLEESADTIVEMPSKPKK